MQQRESRTVFLDIETANLSRRDPVIIELAAVAVCAGSYRELDTLDIKVVFDIKQANLRSLGVNKFSPSVWQRYAIPERAAAEKLSLFLRQNATEVCYSKKKSEPYFLARIAAHNSSFDTERLAAWYKQLGLFFPASRRALCTEQAARWFFENNQGLVPPQNYKLATLADYFGLPAPTHSALDDTRTCLALARTIAESSRRKEMAA